METCINLILTPQMRSDLTHPIQNPLAEGVWGTGRRPPVGGFGGRRAPKPDSKDPSKRFASSD